MSGATWAASSQSGATSTPSPTCASAPSHSGGPRAGVMRGGSVSAPMCSSICRMSGLWVTKACDAHVAATPGAQQREHFVNTGDQHRPQVMRLRPCGCRRFGLGWDRMAQQNHPRRALTHVGWLGLHGDLLGRLCRYSQRHRRSPERRIRGQHTKVAMPVCARGRHQGRMTAMVEAEGMKRRAPAALIGPGDAPASRGLVGIWRGYSRACWLGLQTGALESGDVLMAPSLRLPAAHGRDVGGIQPASFLLDQILLMASVCIFKNVCKRKLVP